MNATIVFKDNAESRQVGHLQKAIMIDKAGLKTEITDFSQLSTINTKEILLIGETTLLIRPDDVKFIEIYN